MTGAGGRFLLLGWQTTIGSGLLSIPAMRAVQEQMGPGSDFWLLTRPAPVGASHPYELLSPWLGLRGVLFLPRLRDLRGWLRLLWQVRQLRLQGAFYIDLCRPHPRATRILSVFSRLAGLGMPRGLPGRWRPGAKPGHEADGRLKNLAADGIPVPHKAVMPVVPVPDHDGARRWLAAHRRPGRRLVALCPGARAAANHWPLDRFAALGTALLRRGDCDLVVCGGAAERDMARTLREEWGAGLVVAGDFDLAGTAHLLAHCDLVIGLDTGTSHLAAALGTPLIVLQGARTPAGRWDPLGPAVTLLRRDPPCAGCGHTHCPLTTHPCMRGIPLPTVIQAVDRRLSPAAGMS